MKPEESLNFTGQSLVPNKADRIASRPTKQRAYCGAGADRYGWHAIHPTSHPTVATAPLPDWMSDPSLLPKHPPGRGAR